MSELENAGTMPADMPVVSQVRLVDPPPPLPIHAPHVIPSPITQHDVNSSPSELVVQTAQHVKLPQQAQQSQQKPNKQQKPKFKSQTLVQQNQPHRHT